MSFAIKASVWIMFTLIVGAITLAAFAVFDEATDMAHRRGDDSGEALNLNPAAQLNLAEYDRTMLVPHQFTS